MFKVNYTSNGKIFDKSFEISRRVETISDLINEIDYYTKDTNNKLRKFKTEGKFQGESVSKYFMIEFYQKSNKINVLNLNKEQYINLKFNDLKFDYSEELLR